MTVLVCRSTYRYSYGDLVECAVAARLPRFVRIRPGQHRRHGQRSRPDPTHVTLSHATYTRHAPPATTHHHVLPLAIAVMGTV